MKSPSIDQKSLRGSASSFVCVGWDPSEFPWSSSPRDLHSWGRSRLRVDSRTPWSLPNNSAVLSAIGNFNYSPLLGVNTSFALSLGAWISDVSKFQAPQCMLPKCLLPTFPPHILQIQGIFLVFSHQIGGALTGHAQKSVDTQPLHQTQQRGLKMVLRIVFHQVFSHLPEGIEHFADSKSIPFNQPTTFHPIQIAIILLMFPSCTLRTSLSAIPCVSDR